MWRLKSFFILILFLFPLAVFADPMVTTSLSNFEQVQAARASRNLKKLLRRGQTYLVHITGVRAYDLGSFEGTDELTLDVVRDICQEEDEEQDEIKEAFYDTLIQFDVRNDFSSDIRLTRFMYAVRNPDPSRRFFRSRKIATLGGLQLSGGGAVTTISGIFLDVQGDNKVFIGSDSAIPADLGIKNIRFYLIGRDPQGGKIVVPVTASFSFANVNRCE